ncbi:RNA recognition motif domain-containing protein [Hippea maritima]|uniref:RNP-1 like RNA-binding protein n=1 Tax=Hippea maritima (strain ATCC 700847 / DSM 10411 / MH2) TaxID=760142 RepID=F2LV04_HIPMA|nr:RNA-binding protein [Hippea maritima]AEA33588.1 RNP-1 like RNA-binding protein [Hippea maritima DSM 10411]
MVKTLYVGNLPYSTTEDELKELFGEYGEVSSTKIITDRETGRSRGFGFVEMSDDDAQKAIDSLNGVNFGGRNLKVNEARERKPRRF